MSDKENIVSGLQEIHSEIEKELENNKKESKSDKKDKINEAKSGSVNYDEAIKREQANRHAILNELLKKLIDPIRNEQENKNKYRKQVLS